MSSEEKNWKITPEILEKLKNIKIKMRELRAGWVNEWREFEPEFKGRKVVYTDLIHGYLTGEGVKYAPLYIDEDGQIIGVYVTTSWQGNHPREYELFMTRNGHDFLLKDVDVNNIYGKLITTEEFLRD